MQKKTSMIALLLALTTVLGIFAACNKAPDDTTGIQSTENIEQPTENNNNNDSETESSEGDRNLPEGEHAVLVENAYTLANGIQTAYNTDRSSYTITNLIGSLDYRLTGSKAPMVSALKNTKGAAYFTDTMDVFVSTESGKTYYASTSGEQARVNLYRLGYYYYDVHFLEQDFVNGIEVEKTTEIPIESFTEYKDTTKPVIEDGVLSAKITNQSDPQVFANVEHSAAEYNTLKFSFKSDAVGYIMIYITAGDSTNHNNKQSITIDMSGAEDWTTYSIPLNSSTIPGYKGQIKSIRFDFGGAVNTSVYLKDVKLQNVVKDSIPLSMDRIIHSFPDKMHQEIHIVAYEDTSNISEIGIETKISPETISKLLVKDKNGDRIFNEADDTKELSRFLKDIDWESAEYVAFDIKGAGIFGYILPYDNKSGKIDISIKHGNIVLTQTAAPEGGTVKAPTNSTVNDFRMGHRLYTDETHDFSAFLSETYCERNPLGENNIKIDSEKFTRGAKFKGYDPLRGVYHITLKGPNGFNNPYYQNQNLHYNASFNIQGDDRDRKLYIMTFTASGVLECAALLDKNDLMLPVPLQVSKNFSEKEEPFYNCGDATYGETFFPIVLDANDEQYYTVLNMYQNWGNFPLKQLSSIGYYMPYYHLSTGVTETNCIAPWYNRGKNLWTLPDHRSMSMPASSDLKNRYVAYGNQPQRPNAGLHYFLQYTDADGNYYSSEYIDNEIFAYGPTYADVQMNYLSDDGKIKVSLRHMEMPQTDENRGYYEMTCEILDTVVIDNFREDFSFYTMAGFQTYRKIGYLSKNNTPAIKDVNDRQGRAFPIPLGNECPYFSLFYIPESKEYSNLSFLIYDSEIIIGGEKTDPGFAVMDENFSLRLTLNLDKKVTLKAGDKITIYAIIMPWGGGYITDDDELYHPMDDVNVQNVRLNTLLNPFKATAVENCEATGSVFLPEVKSTNGKNATFTISGGCDIDPEKADVVNVTVRANGFDSISKLKVEELVDGNWVVYNVSSENNPDNSNNAVSYDGYAIHYDGDGKFGYSFVVAMTDGIARTFKVSVE